MHDSHMAVVCRSLVGQERRRVGGSVVDDEQFVVGNLAAIDQCLTGFARRAKRTMNVLLLVPHRKKDGKQLERWLGRRTGGHSAGKAIGLRHIVGVARVRLTLVLTTPARILLAVGWLGIMIGVGLLGAAAALGGRPTAWAQGVLFLVVWTPPVIAILSARHAASRYALVWSVVGVLGLAIAAATDWRLRPVAGRWELVLTGSAAVVTFAAWLGRVRGGPTATTPPTLS